MKNFSLLGVALGVCVACSAPVRVGKAPSPGFAEPEPAEVSTSSAQEKGPSETVESQAATDQDEQASGVVGPGRVEQQKQDELSLPEPDSGAASPPSEKLSEADGENPLLLDASGVPLPQTDERPSIDSPRFQKQVRLLFEAIQKNDVEIARAFFFPQIAYEQVKDIPKPAADWNSRLFATYQRDIAAYHREMGKLRDQATFEELRVSENLAKWVRPGEEVNKVGYYRVMRSVLVYRDHQGRKRELWLRTMISWRGEWYVVHLK